MVALSPSPQSQPPAQGECIKKESGPSSLSETLEFHLNLYPFTVLCNIIVFNKSWISQKSVIPKNMSDKKKRYPLDCVTLPPVSRPTGCFSHSVLFNIIYQEFLKVNVALNTQEPGQLARQTFFFFLHWHPGNEKQKALMGALKLSKESIWKYVLYLVNLHTVCIVVHWLTALKEDPVAQIGRLIICFMPQFWVDVSIPVFECW